MAKMIAPDEIRVGFNKRSDTLTNMLGFMIYRNKADGTYGFEKSFSSWKDKSIPEKMIGNKFQTGFVINKGQRRFHSYGGNVKIRVYHPEGFEFEIPLDNLAVLLNHCTLEKATIVEKCIVAWDGANVNLIPEILKNEVEVREINQLKEKLSKRKFIPAASCQRFEFYETESGVEFNLGKLESYDVVREKDAVFFQLSRAIQASLPMSYFDDNLSIKGKTSKCILASKKLKEFQVKGNLKSVIDLHKDNMKENPRYRYVSDEHNKIFLRYAEFRLAVMNYGEENIFRENEGDITENFLNFVTSLQSDREVYEKMKVNDFVVMPQVVSIKGKDYYYVFANRNSDVLRGLQYVEGFDYKKDQLVSGDSYKNKTLQNVLKNYPGSRYDLNVGISPYLLSADNFKSGSNLISFNDGFKLPVIHFINSVKRTPEIIAYNKDEVGMYMARFAEELKA